MPRQIRMYGVDDVFFVTARTMQRRLLLRPSTRTNDVIGGVLAQAVERYDVELYAFVFTSNHVHLLVRIRDGLLSRFMQYLLSNIARKVGRLIDWSGTFWERRFAAEPVLDDSAMVGRLAYILAHGVKEGLVHRASQWPGLSCLGQLLDGAARTFRWFNWARRWATRRASAKLPGPFDPELAEPVSLELAVLPLWRNLAPEDRRRLLEKLVADVEAQARQEHGKPPLGVKAVLRQDPLHRPSDRKPKKPKPLCHSVYDRLRAEFRARYQLFVAAFAEASRRYRSGEWAVEFPPFAFRPPIPGSRVPTPSRANPR